MRSRAGTFARSAAIVYAAAVIVVMSFTLWPNSHNVGELLAMILSLPWGLGAVLLLDTIDANLIDVLGPPLVAMCGLFNAYLVHNALRPRQGFPLSRE